MRRGLAVAYGVRKKARGGRVEPAAEDMSRGHDRVGHENHGPENPELHPGHAVAPKLSDIDSEHLSMLGQSHELLPHDEEPSEMLAEPHAIHAKDEMLPDHLSHEEQMAHVAGGGIVDHIRAKIRAHMAHGGYSKKAENFIGERMRVFGKEGMHSGAKEGPVVKDPKQAVAIALSEARQKGMKVPHMADGGESDGRGLLEPESILSGSLVDATKARQAAAKQSKDASMMAHGGHYPLPEDPGYAGGGEARSRGFGMDTYPDLDNSENEVDPEPYSDESEEQKRVKHRLAGILDQVRVHHMRGHS